MAGESLEGSVASDEDPDDDDSLLNFQPFSQSSAELSQQSDPPEESKVDEGQSDNSSEIEKKAAKKANSAQIPENIKSVSQLFWRRVTTSKAKGKKKHTYFMPCRAVFNDEIIGMETELNGWDPSTASTKKVVRYVEYPYEGETECVVPTVLVPYNGDEGSTEQVWSTHHISSYIEHLERDFDGYSQCDIRTVILYLDRILEHAREAEKAQSEAVNEGNEDVSGQASKGSESDGKVSQNDVFDIGLDDDRKTNAVYVDEGVDLGDSSDDDRDDQAPGHKTELIRAGDVITYDSVIYVKGDQRGKKVATILSVDPKRDPVLILGNGDYLSKDTEVKRLQIMWRNKLKIHPDGKYNRLSSFKLSKSCSKEGRGNASDAGIQAEAARLREITERNKAEFLKKAEEIGFAPKDILHSTRKVRAQEKGSRTGKASSPNKHGSKAGGKANAASKVGKQTGKSSTSQTSKKNASKKGHSSDSPNKASPSQGKKKPRTPTSSSKVGKQTDSSKQTPARAGHTPNLTSTPQKKRGPTISDLQTPKTSGSKRTVEDGFPEDFEVTRSGRKRRMATPHMSERQKDLALKVKEALCKKWGETKLLDEVIKSLSGEVDVPSDRLEYFLKGDPKCLIRQDAHKEIEIALRRWLENKQ